jgi:LuxR family maltose regulon positive regulatory protein
VTSATTLDEEPLTVGQVGRQRLHRHLLNPKFRAPKLRRGFVARPRLITRLEQERARPLVLVTGPAGYGKTTLLTQWDAEDPRPFAWVTVDEGDREPESLADSTAIALAGIGIQPGLERSFVLVLDDAHLVEPHVLKDVVLGVLGWLPDGSQLALASRCEPALGLERMRANRLLVEVGAEALSLSAEEAASLLGQAGADLDFTAVQALVRHTGGWPAALELAANSYGRWPRAAEPMALFRGDDHLMSEYFRAEILAPLSPETVRFLTRSSVLDQLSGPLCDDVLERTRSGVMLAELARANLWLAPADASHEWYRLSGLFREMLQTELRRAEPAIQAALHGRASNWYQRAGELDRAIDHARRAKDFGRTGDLLWANLPAYLAGGRNQTVRRWLSGVSAAESTAPLALAAAHSHLASGDVAVAEQWARCATVSLSGASERFTKPERAGVLIIEAWAARSGARAMGEAAARGYDLLPEDSPWRASCCFLRGTAALLTGDDAGAEWLLEEGAARGAVVAPDTASLCLAQLAVVAAERDHPDVASDFARRARSLVLEHGLSEYPTSALVSAVWAADAMRERRVDEAKAAVSECLGLLDALDDSVCWYGAEARILLARVSLALGHVVGARELLAEASRLARRTPDVLVFARWFDAAWNQFDTQAETALAGVATLTTAELRVLRFLPTHYSFHEIAQRLHVSSNTVKTHVHAVYRKLDASSRSQAVAHAVQAGLLGSVTGL